MLGAVILIAWAYFVSRIIDIFADIYDNIKKTAEYQKESTEYLKTIHWNLSGRGTGSSERRSGSLESIATSLQDKDVGIVNEPKAEKKDDGTTSAEKSPPVIDTAKLEKTITFGEYQQYNNSGNGIEAIEWLVLEKTKNQALLISKYCLDYHSYHDKDKNITWEHCSLRAWLNNSFLNTAFTPGEQAAIAVKTIITPDNKEYGTAGGNNTSDKVFLLSVDEVERYLTSNSARATTATNYAKAQGTGVDNNGNARWWLRTPGYDQVYASYVADHGKLYYDYAVSNPNGVRPAMWVNLPS